MSRAVLLRMLVQGLAVLALAACSAGSMGWIRGRRPWVRAGPSR